MMIEYVAQEGDRATDTNITAELGQGKMMTVMMARRRREEEEEEKDTEQEAYEMLLATRRGRAQLMGPTTERKKRGCALPGGNRKKKGESQAQANNEDDGGIIDMAKEQEAEAETRADYSRSRYPDTSPCSSVQESIFGEGTLVAEAVADDSTPTLPSSSCLLVFVFLVLFLLAGPAAPPLRAQLTNAQAIDGDNAPLAISSTTAFVALGSSSSSSFFSLWYPYYCRLATLASSVALQLPIQHHLRPDMNVVEQQHNNIHNNNNNNRLSSMMHKSRSFSSFSTRHHSQHQLEEDDADPTGVYSPLKLARAAEGKGSMPRTVSFVVHTKSVSYVKSFSLVFCISMEWMDTSFDF